MPFFAASEAPPRPESMKFPVFSLLAGNFGIFRDEFAADSPLHRRVWYEPDFLGLEGAPHSSMRPDRLLRHTSPAEEASPP